MLNKIIFFLLPLSIYAANGTVQIRAGYYYPESNLMRKLYHSGGAEEEIEGAVEIYEDLSLFLNGNFFVRSGHSVGLETPTSVQIYPLSLGLKYNFHITPIVDLYLGAAPTYTWAIFHDKSPYVQEKVHTSACGVVGKTGALFFFNQRLFFDLFFDYYYTNLSGPHSSGTTSTSVNSGGFRTGLGCGVKF